MRKGFTLIELITVIIVIAILAALALPQYTRIMERGHVTTAKAALDTIRKAEGVYFSMRTRYTACTSMTACSGSLGVEVPEVSRLNETEWSFIVTNPSVTTFTATATRRSNTMYGGALITMDQDALMSGNHPLR